VRVDSEQRYAVILAIRSRADNITIRPREREREREREKRKWALVSGRSLVNPTNDGIKFSK
jgi:hypothetical protein